MDADMHNPLITGFLKQPLNLLPGEMQSFADLRLSELPFVIKAGGFYK
jgi:hypothetical protein